MMIILEKNYISEKYFRPSEVETLLEMLLS